MAKDYKMVVYYKDELKSDIDELCSDICNTFDEIYSKGYAQGLEEIESFQENKYTAGYEQGLSDAWEAARKIVCPPDCYEGGLYGKISKIFGAEYDTYLVRGIFKNFTASEVIQKINDYSEGQKIQEFNVGDEVTFNNGITTLIVTKLYANDSVIETIDADGVSKKYKASSLTKTGRHFDFGDLLNNLKAGDD